MAGFTVKVEGLRDLEASLRALPKATGKAVLRRVLLKRAKPVADAANSRAPRDTGHLASSGTVGTKLSRRQRSLHKAASGGAAKMTAAGWRSDPKSSVEVFVGYPSTPKSIVGEFGSVDQPAQPFMRPAWDREQDGVLEGLKDDLWQEIEKTAKRIAKRAAKKAAAGG